MAIRPQRMPWVILATILLLEAASSGESNPVKKRHDPPLQTLQEEPDLYDVPLINKDYRGIDPDVIESGDEILANLVVGNRGAEEAGSAATRFYASVDAQITADDRQIGGGTTLIARTPTAEQIRRPPAGSLTWT